MAGIAIQGDRSPQLASDWVRGQPIHFFDRIFIQINREGLDGFAISRIQDPDIVFRPVCRIKSGRVPYGRVVVYGSGDYFYNTRGDIGETIIFGDSKNGCFLEACAYPVLSGNKGLAPNRRGGRGCCAGEYIDTSTLIDKTTQGG